MHPTLLKPPLSTVPRELRDMVYDLLWTRPVVEAMDERISSVDTSRYLAALNSIPTLPVPFFTNPRFVGPAFAHEAAIYYLRAISRAEIPYRCVRNYLQRNTFGPLRFPWLDVIHRLTIALDWEICNGEHVAHADLQDSLARLLDLRDRENLTVTIYLSRDFQYSRALFPTLDVIAPFYHALSESKLTVKILGYQFFAPGETSRGNLVQGDDDTTSEQLNYYFAGSAEDWLAMKAAEIETIARPGLRKKCFSVSCGGCDYCFVRRANVRCRYWKRCDRIWRMWLRRFAEENLRRFSCCMIVLAMEMLRAIESGSHSTTQIWQRV